MNAAQIFLFNGTSFVLLSSIVLKAFTKNRFGLVTNERVFRCKPSVTRIFTNFVYGSQSFMKGTVERSSNFPFQQYKFRSLIFYSFDKCLRKTVSVCNKRTRFQMPTVCHPKRLRKTVSTDHRACNERCR